MTQSPRAAWESALTAFLAPWRARRDVRGALVCGSYVRGDVSPRSDIDVQILLADEVGWEERGNRVVDGYLFEYFANTAERKRHFFEHGRSINRPGTLTMFATGRLVFDSDGRVEALRREALRLLERPLPKLSRADVEWMKYACWDSLDNLHDLFERGLPVAHAYHDHLHGLYSDYARFLREPVLPASQLGRYLREAKFRAKYLLTAFPDARFRRALARALVEEDPEAMLRAATRLTHHAIEALGGFDVDGWRLRKRT